MFTTGEKNEPYLKVRIKKTVLKTISKLEFVDGELTNWDNPSVEFINFVLIYHVITTDELKAVLHERMITLGRDSCKKKTSPRSTLHPWAVAYALEKEVLSQKEKSNLQYGIVDSEENFITQYNTFDVLSYTFKKLRTFRLPKSSALG